MAATEALEVRIPRGTWSWRVPLVAIALAASALLGAAVGRATAEDIQTQTPAVTATFDPADFADAPGGHVPPRGEYGSVAPDGPYVVPGTPIRRI